MNHTVALDARMIRHSGIGTYVRHLAWGLARRKPVEGLAFQFYGQPDVLSQFLPDVSPAQIHPFKSSIYSLWEHLEYWRLKKQWDIWHCPHYNVPFVKKGRLVVTVHDLIHLVYRGQFFSMLQGWYAQKNFEWVRDKADAVIAVSHHTKKDLVKWVGMDPEKITVIHEGVAPDFRPILDAQILEILQKKYRLANKFVMHVGNIKPHKNVGQLVRVFRELRSKNLIQEDLLLVGRIDKKWIKRDKDLTAACSDPCIRFMGEVPMEDLPGLYNLARAAVLPSLYEGFGLTALEAMACGVPLLSSDCASLPEVVGDAALIFDPRSDEQLRSSLQVVLHDSERREKLIALGQRRIAGFSWQKAVEETIGVYRRV